MNPLARTGGILLLAAVLFLPCASQAGDGAVQNQISVYTGANAEGYLQPLVNAFGAALNSSFGYSAYIPASSFHISLEAPVMGVLFGDDDRTFNATTESGFQPAKTMSVPTVVGDGKAVIVSGSGGAQFAFPGGLDLNSFGLVVPQFRVSSLKGTEAVIRWIAFEQGDADLGKVALFGIGARHDIAQYLGDAPVLDLAVGILWQSFDVGETAGGDDFVSTSAFATQVQASKRTPLGFMTFEPYAALAFENLSVDVAYEDSNGAAQAISLDGENSVRFTFGAGFNFAAGHVWADYSVANTNNFSFGLALGNVGRP